MTENFWIENPIGELHEKSPKKVEFYRTMATMYDFGPKVKFSKRNFLFQIIIVLTKIKSYRSVCSGDIIEKPNLTELLIFEQIQLEQII